MAMVNVNRKVTDQFYRYKMPKIIAKVEGKGNGIKTVIVNMVDVAKALIRPPAYPTKFFGCELGAQTQIDKKNDRYIVNGSHSSEKLQEILDGFVEKFVLCEECDNPETSFVVQPKKEKITSICAACGHSSLIDMRHRLATFILKNPPLDDSATPSKMKAVAKKEKHHENGETSPNEESGFDGWSDDITTKSTSNVDDWGDDTSSEAVKKRMLELGEGVKGLTYNDDLEKSVEERFNIFFKFVNNKINEGAETLPAKDIVAEAERLDIKDKAVLGLAELLLNENILTQLPKYRVLFLRFLASNHKAQKNFMGAFELIVGQSFPNELMPKAATILKAFYDQDLVEEEIILEWGAKVSKKYVKKEISDKIHQKAKPFLDWLKEAEEESDEEDDDVEIVYTNRTEEAILKEEARKTAALTAEPEADGGDDIDIDDI